MAEVRQFIDVWIIESNTVYREVPYTVVCDWVQQGRLLEDDCLRRSGTAEWKKIGGVPAFAAFLPKPEPTRAVDMAEALDRVEFEFGWKKKHVEPDDDEVDMIPLIDVSLVLLIFFMMTASSVAAASLVSLVGVKNPPVTDTTGLSINMVVIKSEDGKQRNILYSLGEDGKPVLDEKGKPPKIDNRQDLLELLDKYLKKKTEPVELTINPDKDLEDGELVKMLRDVKTVPSRAKIRKVYNGITEAKP